MRMHPLIYFRFCIHFYFPLKKWQKVPFPRHQEYLISLRSHFFSRGRVCSALSTLVTGYDPRLSLEPELKIRIENATANTASRIRNSTYIELLYFQIHITHWFGNLTYNHLAIFLISTIFSKVLPAVFLDHQSLQLVLPRIFGAVDPLFDTSKPGEETKQK